MTSLDERRSLQLQIITFRLVYNVNFKNYLIDMWLSLIELILTTWEARPPARILINMMLEEVVCLYPSAEDGKAMQNIDLV